TVIFPSDEAFETAYKEVEEEIKRVQSFEGRLEESSEVFLKALEALLDMSRKLENVYVYSHLKNDQDTSNSHYQALNDRAQMLATNAGEAMSWFEPEVLSLHEEKLEQYQQENSELKKYSHYLERVTDNRDHVLSKEMESLLAGAGEIFSSPSRTFSVLNNADITFPTVKNEEGEEVQLSHGLYGQLIESTDRSVREEAFKNLY